MQPSHHRTFLAVVASAFVIGPSAQAQAPPTSLADSRNNIGIAYDALSGADFDGAAAAFSGAALELADVTPGSTVTSDGMDFVWPDTASGEADNVQARGQSIAISGAQGAWRLGVLAAAHGGDVSAPLQLTYIDAAGVTTVESATIAVGDWLDADHEVSTDFHVLESAVPVPLAAGLDAVVVPLDPTRTLVSIGLPNEPRLHLFDLSTRTSSGGGVSPPEPLPAHSTVVALPAGNFTGFAPISVPLIEGQPLDFTNLDPMSPHDVVSVKRGPDYKRLFTSASVPAGQTTPVVGVEKLPVGTYDFICSVHGTMTGQLIVQAAP